MWTGGLDPMYRLMLATSHTPTFRIEVWRGTEKIVDDLEYEDGNVTATLASQISRQFDFTCSGDLYPRNPDDVLNPYTDYVKAFRGIALADGFGYEFPTFRGRIIDIDLLPNGMCSVACQDRGLEVQEAAFTVPENSVVGQNVFTEFQRLVTNGIADATFGDSDFYEQVMPQLTWEHDRASALDEIATSIGSFWYALADGAFVMRHVPWTLLTPPIATLRHAAGEIINFTPHRSRSTVFNSITITGERTDGTEPVYATVTDNNPDSPTYIGGPFGIRNRLINLLTPTTVEIAADAAQVALKRSIGRTETWDLTIPVDPSLELGDTLQIEADDRKVIQVISSMTVPMIESTPMNLQMRSQVIGLVEDD
jgi:hypothetical protein